MATKNFREISIDRGKYCGLFFLIILGFIQLVIKNKF